MNEDTNEINEETLLRLQLLSQRLDESITLPGTKYKIGIDPIIGLIPGGGDVIGGILSMYIMHTGIKMGVQKTVIIKMFRNIALDFLIGWIPIIGDIFDIVWKSNQKNVKLIEKSLNLENDNTLLGYMMILLLILILVIVIAGLTAIIL